MTDYVEGHPTAQQRTRQGGRGRTSDEELGGLEEQIARVQEERDELSARVERSTTELDKARERHERERGEAVRFANERVVLEMIPVLDNMERALAADASSPLRPAYEELLATLQRYGVTQFSTLGQAFDPRRAEAVSMREVPGTEPNVVIDELRRGYTLHDRLLRPALVVVSG